MKSSVKDVLLARQPIFSAKHDIYAYELLYRSKDTEKANVEDGDIATSELLLNVCASINDDEEVFRYPLFFNVTRNLLMSESFFPVTANTAVIEILETVKVDQALYDQMAKLKRKKYNFALDDYQFDEYFDPIISLCKYIKVDVLAVDLSKHAKDIERLLSEGKILIAERVETYDIYNQCVALGFQYFQGFYLEKPKLIEGRKISANASLALTIIGELQKPDTSFEHISYLVSQDPKLSFQLLKILNSPAQGLKREVTSLKQAVIFLGLDALKKWVLLISLIQHSQSPDSFFNILLTRARACELFASVLNLSDADSYFTMGLFSGLDAVLHIDMEEIVKQISVPKTLEEALLYRAGFMGKTLDKIMLFEKADWIALNAICSWSECSLISTLMEQAHEWSDKILADIKD